ncbi:RING-H2 finger protein ATL66-like [Rutidosis leptorrhynchoides]|uniref:RING-H2 finger protein ATL66-like n=1 Tax=Rutidosis leptorrhynchoides TaxID=125765 RepID=UPI003A9A4955
MSVEEMECCICLGVFDEGDEVKVLPKCSHTYNFECVVEHPLISNSSSTSDNELDGSNFQIKGRSIFFIFVLFGVKEMECFICLGVSDEGDEVKVLPKCSHTYHCECVDKWLSTHSSCLICRAVILVDSHV